MRGRQAAIQRPHPDWEKDEFFVVGLFVQFEFINT